MGLRRCIGYLDRPTWDSMGRSHILLNYLILVEFGLLIFVESAWFSTVSCITLVSTQHLPLSGLGINFQ